jgi:aldehyde:ferredoxin oxidoreductase
MAKSPLRHAREVATWEGSSLRWHPGSFHHLVIKGKAEKPVYLWVHNGKIEIRDAKNIWGKTVTDAQWAIRDELGDEDVKSLVIGPAGENLVRYANVMTGIKNSGGRTGMGAVMGSKNLKAVAARGTMDIKIAHPKKPSNTISLY